DADYLVVEARDCIVVPRDAEVLEVTAQLPPECPVLHTDIVVEVLPAPVRDPFQCSPEAVLRSAALDGPLAGARFAPVVGEAEQVERCSQIREEGLAGSSTWRRRSPSPSRSFNSRPASGSSQHPVSQSRDASTRSVRTRRRSSAPPGRRRC